MEYFLKALIILYIYLVPISVVLKTKQSGIAFIISLVSAVIGFLILKMPKVKGYFGERSIRKKLEKLDNEEYVVINDITLPTEKGTTQIDHIIVSIYGIFVIETKNYSGWIFGDEKSDKWTQVIYKNKEHFHNPTHQNYGHIMALKNILYDMPNLKYISIVAFSPNCDLKVKVTSSVIYSTQILKELAKYKETVISIKEATDIYNKLMEISITDKDEKRNIYIGLKKIYMKKN